jgi:hypothetical protein
VTGEIVQAGLASATTTVCAPRSGRLMVEMPPGLDAALEGLTVSSRRRPPPGPGLTQAERLERIRLLYEYPRTRLVAELLIDLESDASARLLVIDALRVRGGLTCD